MIYAASSLAWQTGGRSLADTIASIAHGGYRAIEVNAGTPQLPADGLPGSEYARVKAMVDDLGLRLAVHAPAVDLNPLSINPDVQRLTFDQYVAAMGLARALGAGLLTVHLGTMSFPGFPRDRAMERCVGFFCGLLDRLDAAGPVLALENVAWGYRNPFESVSDYLAIADALRDPRVGFTLDLGHAYLAGLDAAAFIREAGPRLVNVHVHDNDGSEDWHWPLATGCIDFRPVALALDEARYSGPLTYECVSQRATENAALYASRWQTFGAPGVSG